MDEAVPNQREQDECSGQQRRRSERCGVSRSRSGARRARRRPGRRLVVGHQVQRGAVVGQSRSASTARRRGASTGTSPAFQKDIHPEDQPEVMAAIQESLRTGKTYQAHYRLAPRVDEEERWVEAVASVIQENGAPVRLLGICRDVTDRQKLLRELRVRAKQQETRRAARRARADRDRSAEAVRRRGRDRRGDSRRRVREDSRAGAGRRRAAAARRRRLERRDWSGPRTRSTGRHSQAGYALASGGPVIVTDLKSETRFESAGAAARSRRQQRRVSVPIAGRDGRAYGVLGAHTARRRRFGEYDVVVPQRDRQPDRRRDPAPPGRPAPRADDPRAAPSFGQPVRAAARAVLADRAQLAQRAPIS